MYQSILLKWVHPGLQIGLQDIKHAWLLGPDPVQLTTSVHRGNLIYRLPGSGKRISYLSLKKGLIRKQQVIKIPFNILPF